MKSDLIAPLDEEIRFGENEIIVSKTDTRGKIVYANDVFCRVAEMSTREVVGRPHNIIRHPDMPGAIFKLLWNTISGGEEIFAYVKNMSKTGKFYWVIAHVTPSFDACGKIVGYHSNRRRPSDQGISDIAPLYANLLKEERMHPSRKLGIESSFAHLEEFLAARGKSYSQFIWSTGE